MCWLIYVFIFNAITFWRAILGNSPWSIAPKQLCGAHNLSRCSPNLAIFSALVSNSSQFSTFLLEVTIQGLSYCQHYDWQFGIYPRVLSDNYLIHHLTHFCSISQILLGFFWQICCCLPIFWAKYLFYKMTHFTKSPLFIKRVGQETWQNFHGDHWGWKNWSALTKNGFKEA